MSNPYGERAGLIELRKKADGMAILSPDRIIATGFSKLDRRLGGGLRTGQVSVIGASSGHGKTSLVEQIALNASRTVRTAFFCLEMGRRLTLEHMLGKLLSWPHETVVEQLASFRRNERLVSTLRALCNERDLIIVERWDEHEYAFNHLAGVWLELKPDLVIIDHPRHLDDWNGAGDKRTDLAAAAIVRRIVDGAKLTDAHVIIVAQTQKKLFGRKPQMSDLADTYVLAQVASTVIMVHRPYRGQGVADTVAELIVDKNRNGPEGVEHLHWSGRIMSYSDMLPGEEATLDCCHRKPTILTPIDESESRSEPDDSGEQQWFF